MVKSNEASILEVSFYLALIIATGFITLPC